MEEKMITLLLVLAVVFLAMSNGANDNFKGVATIYGSGIAQYRTALAWATAATLAGSVTSIFVAGTLLAKFSGKGLVPDAAAASEIFILAVIMATSFTVLLATRLGFPISTTHSMIGGLVGAGVMAVGPTAINFAALGKGFFLPLLLSPLMAIVLGAALAGGTKFLREPARKAGNACLCLMPVSTRRVLAVGGDRATMVHSFGALSEDHGGDLGASIEFCMTPGSETTVIVRATRAMDTAHFVSAGAVSFARGLNDTAKIAAPLMLVAGIAPSLRSLLVALAMAVGGVLGAKRIAETMSHKITRMSSGEGFVSNLSTSVLVILATLMGAPVSTTHLSVGSLIGIGAVNRKANWETVGSIVLSWVITLPCAALLGGICYILTARVLG
jgi:inorganic phosphate transporter, PiT family